MPDSEAKVFELSKASEGSGEVRVAYAHTTRETRGTTVIDYQPDFEPGKPWLAVGPATGEYSVSFGGSGHAAVPRVAHQLPYATFAAAQEAHPDAGLSPDARAQLRYLLERGQLGCAYLPDRSPTGEALARFYSRRGGEWVDSDGRRCPAGEVRNLVPTEGEALRLARHRWKCSR